MYYKHIYVCVYICTINIKCTIYVILFFFLPTEGRIILELKGTPTIKSEIYTDEQNELSLEE